MQKFEKEIDQWADLLWPEMIKDETWSMVIEKLKRTTEMDDFNADQRNKYRISAIDMLISHYEAMLDLNSEDIMAEREGFK
uniref:Uncharacterized protein n=1 Tax=Romanomermis culicivorax TaxID=13658 RepID=A0A915HEK6_ROMCU